MQKKSDHLSKLIDCHSEMASGIDCPRTDLNQPAYPGGPSRRDYLVQKMEKLNIRPVDIFRAVSNPPDNFRPWVITIAVHKQNTIREDFWHAIEEGLAALEKNPPKLPHRVNLHERLGACSRYEWLVLNSKVLGISLKRLFDRIETLPPGLKHSSIPNWKYQKTAPWEHWIAVKRTIKTLRENPDPIKKVVQTSKQVTTAGSLDSHPE